MARPATGQVVFDERRRSPMFGLRFRAYGQRHYITLGSVDDGWNQARAEVELQNVLADVRRGIWRPPSPAPVPPAVADPTFHGFASAWFDANEGAWRPNTRLDYKWQLTDHLLPFFREHRLSQITIAEVDRYRAMKVREGVLSATSINKTLSRLGQILEVAIDHELIERNPAKGKRRRLKAARPAPVWLDRAEHIRALADAAGELDRKARRDRQHVSRQAIVATLVFAGLRIGELLDLRWRDLDLVAGHITVRASKTDAKLPRRGPDDLMFPTTTGG
jgi:integrase